MEMKHVEAPTIQRSIQPTAGGNSIAILYSAPWLFQPRPPSGWIIQHCSQDDRGVDRGRLH